MSAPPGALARRRSAMPEFSISAPLNSDSGVVHTTKIKRAENDDGKRSVNDYVMLHQLGSGAYGKVRLCVDQRTAERVALKIMSKALLRKRRDVMSSRARSTPSPMPATPRAVSMPVPAALQPSSTSSSLVAPGLPLPSPPSTSAAALASASATAAPRSATGRSAAAFLMSAIGDDGDSSAPMRPMAFSSRSPAAADFGAATASAMTAAVLGIGASPSPTNAKNISLGAALVGDSPLLRRAVSEASPLPPLPSRPAVVSFSRGSSFKTVSSGASSPSTPATPGTISPFITINAPRRNSVKDLGVDGSGIGNSTPTGNPASSSSASVMAAAMGFTSDAHSASLIHDSIGASITPLTAASAATSAIGLAAPPAVSPVPPASDIASSSHLTPASSTATVASAITTTAPRSTSGRSAAAFLMSAIGDDGDSSAPARPMTFASRSPATSVNASPRISVSPAPVDAALASSPASAAKAIHSRASSLSAFTFSASGASSLAASPTASPRAPRALLPSPMAAPPMLQQFSSSALDKVRREIEIHQELVHPNVVRLREVLNDEADDKLYLVLDVCEGGELLTWDPKRLVYSSPVFTPANCSAVCAADTMATPPSLSLGGLPLNFARHCIRQIIAGVEYMHSQRVIHRDLKPDNVMLHADGSVRVGDLGVAHRFTDEEDGMMSDSNGTYAFFAPEQCGGLEYDAYMADVWALGVTAFALVYGRLPHAFTDHAATMFQRIQSGVIEYPPPPSEEAVGAAGVADALAARAFLERVLAHTVVERAGLDELKAHPWLQAPDDVNLAPFVRAHVERTAGAQAAALRDDFDYDSD